MRSFAIASLLGTALAKPQGYPSTKAGWCDRSYGAARGMTHLANGGSHHARWAAWGGWAATSDWNDSTLAGSCGSRTERRTRGCATGALGTTPGPAFCGGYTSCGYVVQIGYMGGPNGASQTKTVTKACVYGGTCTNGNLAANPTQDNQCGSCNAGYGLQNKACVAFDGECTNGSLIAQASRTQDNHCGSCDAGYHLQGKACVANNVFFQADSVPSCSVINGHTVVKYTDAIHASFKCTHTSSTTCTCTAKHPTHHSGGCKQLESTGNTGKIHSFDGDCTDSGLNPVNGAWSSYSGWSACSKDCGSGTQSKTRTCDGIVNGGADCSALDGGSATASRNCNEQSCTGWVKSAASCPSQAAICSNAYESYTCMNNDGSGQVSAVVDKFWSFDWGGNRASQLVTSGPATQVGVQIRAAPACTRSGCPSYPGSKAVSLRQMNGNRYYLKAHFYATGQWAYSDISYTDIGNYGWSQFELSKGDAKTAPADFTTLKFGDAVTVYNRAINKYMGSDGRFTSDTPNKVELVGAGDYRLGFLKDGYQIRFKVGAASACGANPDAVQWKNPSTVTTDARGGMFGGTRTSWSNGAISTRKFSGDAVLRVKCPTNDHSFIGFTKTPQSGPHRYFNIDCALYCNTNKMGVYEGQYNKAPNDTFGSFDENSELEVRRIGSTVSFWKDGNKFYTCSKNMAGELHVDTSLVSKVDHTGILSAILDTTPTQCSC